MDNDLAWRDLIEVKRILNKIKVPFFLSYGTCLGAYRDGEFLSNDKDIDLGIFGQEGLNIVCAVLEGVGFNRRRWPAKKYLAMNRNVILDIHFYKEVSDKYQCFINDWKGYCYFPKKFNSFEKIDFRGEKFNVLKPVEEYLFWCYGEDWKDKTNRKSAKITGHK